MEEAYLKTINMILQQDCAYETGQEIAAQITYMGQRYPTKVWAEIIRTYANKDVLKFLIKKYLFKKVAPV